jgi:hypothetical protein
MNLKLDFPPTAENAARHAQAIVDAMKENEGIALDFTPNSIRELDGVLMKFHQKGLTIERIPSILFRIGCYVGEVILRKLPESQWVNPTDVTPPLDQNLFPFIVIKHSCGSIWAPVNKAFAVLDDPNSNSLSFSFNSELASRQPKTTGILGRMKKIFS